MPRKYLIEMVCDWRSFSRKWGRKINPSTLNLTDKIILHANKNGIRSNYEEKTRRG